MTVILPLEILLHIARFIPPKYLARLYSVNRMFMKLAFEAKYGTVDIDSSFWCPVEGHRYVKHLKRLSKPHAAQHIRTLNIRASFSFDQVRDNLVTRCWSNVKYRLLPLAFGPWSRSISSIIGSSLWRYERFIRNTLRLTKIIPAHSTITTLALTFPHRHSRCSIGTETLIQTLVASVAHSIQHLALDGNAERILESIPEKPIFSGLRSLRITLTDGDVPQLSFRSSIDGRSAALQVAQRFSLYADTLDTLSLTLPSWSEFDATALFGSLSDFAQLHSLCLRISWRRYTHFASVLFDFVGRHASQLHHLVIPPPILSPDGNQHIIPTQLRSLEICSNAQLDIDAATLTRYIQQSAPTVECLSLDFQLPQNDSCTFHESIDPRYFLKLTRLRLRRQYLTPADVAEALKQFSRITSLEFSTDRLLLDSSVLESSNPPAYRMDTKEGVRFLEMVREWDFGRGYTRSLTIWVRELVRIAEGYEMKISTTEFEQASFRVGRPTMFVL